MASLLCAPAAPSSRIRLRARQGDTPRHAVPVPATVPAALARPSGGCERRTTASAAAAGDHHDHLTAAAATAPTSTTPAADPPAFPDGPSHGDGDTIVAVATASGPAAVGVVRLSGPAALAVAARVFRPSSGRAWTAASHTVTHGTAVDPSGGAATGTSVGASAAVGGGASDAAAVVVDEVLALAFRAPRSYTREDVVELHTHGGPVCAPRVAAACVAAGARSARPGEFTLRAFLSGRLDLSQAEAVHDVVTARTPAAVDSALAGLGVGGGGRGGGRGLGASIAAARRACLALLAEVEASLDFDEGDAPDLAGDAAAARLTPLIAAVDAALATQAAGQLARRGVQVAIVGAPNVGKSSLLNALVGADRAIVADIPGTTRDVVEAGAALHGVAATLLDTAGVRADVDGPAEADGVARAAAAAGGADVLALVFDGAAGWGAGDDAALAALSGGGGGAGAAGLAGLPPTVLVANKADAVLEGGRSRPPPPPPAVSSAVAATCSVSAATGAGLADLRAALATVAAGPGVAPGGWGATVNARQADALIRARAGLAAAAADAAAGAPSDCWSLGVREAVTALGEVTGDDVVEEVLDSVFSRFCVGK